MPGRTISRSWRYDPTIDAPARYKRACKYDAFIPDELASLDVQLDAPLAGLVSEAEHAIRQLNDEGGPALAPLARLLLRTESIASSKVEGMQLGVRELARAEARAESGITPGPTAIEVLANIDAMVVAVDQAAEVESFGVAEILAIHRRLLERAPHKRIAGRLRTQQNWIGGNDYNPCGADFVPPPAEHVDRLLADLCAAINDETQSPLLQAALVHAQFETIHPFDDGNGRTGRALVHVVLRRRGIAPRFLPPISVEFARARGTGTSTGPLAFAGMASPIGWSISRPRQPRRRVWPVGTSRLPAICRRSGASAFEPMARPPVQMQPRGRSSISYPLIR